MPATLDYRYYKTPLEIAKHNRKMRMVLCKTDYSSKVSGSPPILPIPSNSEMTLYTDASWFGSGKYGWAYIVVSGGEFEEIWGQGIGATDNNDAEILSAISAIEETNPPVGFCLVYDSMAIGSVCSGVARCRTRNQILLKEINDRLKPVLRWFPGHGKKTPRHLARCDELAR